MPTRLNARQVPDGWVMIRKLAAQTKASNVTLANDTDLIVTLAAGTYRVFFSVMFETGNATMDYKYALNFSGTASGIRVWRKHMAAGIAAGTDTETVQTGTTLPGSTSVAATTSGLALVEIDLTLTVTVAGVLGFQWAQDTSNGSNLTVHRGSYLEYVSM